MKKLYFVFVLISLFSFVQAKTYTINHHNFILENHKVEEYESDRTDVVNLYRGKKKLLSHTLFEEDGDCSSIMHQLGDYLVENNNIIFYTYWASADRMTLFLRFGFQKQVYSVADNGIVQLKSSKIYIEDSLESANPDFVEDNRIHKGIAYLNKPPTTDEEKMWLDDYITSIEKQYKAEFVFGEERKALEKEVRMKLEKKIEKYTKDWDKFIEKVRDRRLLRLRRVEDSN